MKEKEEGLEGERASELPSPKEEQSRAGLGMMCRISKSWAQSVFFK